MRIFSFLMESGESGEESEVVRTVVIREQWDAWIGVLLFLMMMMRS